jgi:hypothetical protein
MAIVRSCKTKGREVVSREISTPIRSFRHGDQQKQQREQHEISYRHGARGPYVEGWHVPRRKAAQRAEGRAMLDEWRPEDQAIGRERQRFAGEINGKADDQGAQGASKV